MRLHLKNLSPEAHGFIAQDKAQHDHKNLEETMECIIKRAATVSRLITDIHHMAKPVGDPGNEILVVTMQELFNRLNYLFPKESDKLEERK